MTNPTAVVSDVDADIRWRDWKARGAGSDRRSAAGMRAVLVLLIVAVVGWLAVQLV